MNKETYERLKMELTQFDAEDVITTSEVIPEFHTGEDELAGTGIFFPGSM